ncbi:MAG: UPF0182 family protein [Dehalococcoidia bacterium]|nr:UPF0182 family protein [Dehalococcoidia bacterium]
MGLTYSGIHAFKADHDQIVAALGAALAPGGYQLRTADVALPDGPTNAFLISPPLGNWTTVLPSNDLDGREFTWAQTISQTGGYALWMYLYESQFVMCRLYLAGRLLDRYTSARAGASGNARVYRPILPPKVTVEEVDHVFRQEDNGGLSAAERFARLATLLELDAAETSYALVATYGIDAIAPRAPEWRYVEFVYVGSTDPDLEFDFPRGDENVSTRYQGTKGVSLASPLNRLLAAYRFADPNIMISSYIGPETQLLFTRNVRDRARKIAPFLEFDRDPYIVVHDGRLVWILDAYTVSDRFPYSDPFRRVVAGQTVSFNYIRNSVKVTIDAYDGGVTFYVMDDVDPMLRAYRQVFPALFRPISEMPTGLRAHLRYPEFLFSVQADRFALYHMTDPQVFFNREDQWAIPRDLYAPGQNALPMEPYYVIMKLPGETREEFALILPFTPSARDNMIAWLAARSDGDNYGRLLVARFPKDRLVFGPAQIGARINQDPTISAQITLWNQQGSRVIRGNLLVLPIERSILYIEPIYLQAERSQLPELKRVVLATANRVVMEPTLAEGLARLLNQPLPTASTPGQPSPGQPGRPSETISTDVAALARAAQARFERAQQRLREGDFAGYGEEIRLLEAELRRLVELTSPR